MLQLKLLLQISKLSLEFADAMVGFCIRLHRYKFLQLSNKMLGKGFRGNVLSLCSLCLHCKVGGSGIDVHILSAELCKYLTNPHHFGLCASNKEVCFLAMGYPSKPVAIPVLIQEHGRMQ